MLVKISKDKQKPFVNEDNVRKDRMMDYGVWDTVMKSVKPGEHWCSNMTLAEAIADTRAYIESPNWSGRKGFQYFDANVWIIKHICDISEYAKSVDKFYPHAKVDEIIFAGANKNRLKSAREVFDMGFEEYMSVRNKAIEGSSNIEIFPPHEFQNDYAEFRNERIIASKNKVGNESVTRWGKTFGVYNADYELLKDPRFSHKHMKTLVYSGKPKCFSAWERDINHVKFDGWVFKNSQKIKDVCFEDNDTNEYIVASTQGNHKGSKQRYISRIAQITKQWNDPEFRKNNFCKLVLEECHTNLMTKKELEFIELLNPDLIEYVSGTMGTVLRSGMVDPTDVYRFSLIHAQEAKANNHFRFKDFPTPSFIVNNHSQVFTSENPENPNFAKALNWSGAMPTYNDDVDAIFTSIAADKGSRKEMPLLANSRTCQNIDPRLFNYTTNHGWIVVPSGKGDDDSSVGAQSTVEYYLNNTSQSYWNKYKPLPVSAGGMNEAEVNRQQHQNEYTQVISGGALNTGTTFEKLDHQIWLTESSSYAEFWQTVGRLLEITKGKDIVPVVLPTWNMFVEMFKELALYSQKPGQPLDDVVKIMLDMLPGIDWTGEPKVIDWSAMVQAQLSTNLKGASWKNPNVVNYNNIKGLSKDEANSIPNLEDPSKAGPRKTDVNGENEGHNSGGNIKIEKQKKSTVATAKSAERKILNIMKHMPSVIANAYMGGYTCNNHLDIMLIPNKYFNAYVCEGAKDQYVWFVGKKLIDTNEIDKRVEYDRYTLDEAFLVNKVDK